MSGGMWTGGTVLEARWRDEEMEQGQVCPYKVRSFMWERARCRHPAMVPRGLVPGTIFVDLAPYVALLVAGPAGQRRHHVGAV